MSQSGRRYKLPFLSGLLHLDGALHGQGRNPPNMLHGEPMMNDPLAIHRLSSLLGPSIIIGFLPESKIATSPSHAALLQYVHMPLNASTG